MTKQEEYADLELYERRIALLRFLQGKSKRTGEMAEHFQVDERTIRSDINALEGGWNFMNAIIQIESRHVGEQKHRYTSTVHPIFLALNASELFSLLKLLEQYKSKENGFIYENIFHSIYSQITDYAEELIAGKLEGNYDKTKIVNQLEEEAEYLKYIQWVYWAKSGRYIPVTFIKNNNTVEGEYRVLQLLDKEVALEDRLGNKVKLPKDDVIIDWENVGYK